MPCIGESPARRKWHRDAFDWSLSVLAQVRGLASAISRSLMAESVGWSGQAAGYDFLSPVILFLMVSGPVGSTREWRTHTAVGTPGTVQAMRRQTKGGESQHHRLSSWESCQGPPSGYQPLPLPGLTGSHCRCPRGPLLETKEPWLMGQ